jgi:hypothetical protein
MSLTLSDIDAVRRKTHNPIEVGELPNLIRLALRLRVPLVQLSTESLAHINARHPDISDFDLLLLPFVIRHGMILRERKKTNIILAVYQEPMSHRRFVAAMKIADASCQVWLDSFYRIKPGQTRKLMRKTDMLKPHYLK